MVWNVEAQGAQRSFRVMQKRGVVVDADDFLPVRGTYPEHEMTSKVPNASTYGELRQKRKDSSRKQVELANKTFDAKRAQC